MYTEVPGFCFRKVVQQTLSVTLTSQEVISTQTEKLFHIKTCVEIGKKQARLRRLVGTEYGDS